ncbi:MAG: acyl carrier protein [Pseudomonadota bacterium]
MNSNESRLVDYIRSVLLEDAEFALSTEDELLLGDIVDSMGIMRLVQFIEDESGGAVPAEDITIEHFATVASIGRYLDQRDLDLGAAGSRCD